MQQKIFILVLHIIIQSCCLVCSENHLPDSKINKKTSAQDLHKNWDLSDCGRRAIPDDIVSNSTEASVLKWPWVASIYFTDPSDNIPKYYGTATIITEKYLITVAQVFAPRNTSDENHPTDYFAVVGGVLGGKGFVYNIQNVYIQSVHGEDHSPLGAIALVKLVNAMTLTDFVRPICLPKMKDQDIGRNKTDTAVGWSYSLKDFSKSVVLYEVNVPILPEQYCQQFIPGTYPIENLICGENSKEMTCKLYNGAALMTSVYDELNNNNKFTLIGLTDRGIGREPFCGNPEIPIYFLKVASYIDLIADIIHKSDEY